MSTLGRPTETRFDFSPLDHGTTVVVAARLDVSERSVIRWRQTGVPFHSAEKVAIRDGRHPLELWPDYYDPAPLDPWRTRNG